MSTTHILILLACSSIIPVALWILAERESRKMRQHARNAIHAGFMAHAAATNFMTQRDALNMALALRDQKFTEQQQIIENENPRFDFPETPECAK